MKKKKFSEAKIVKVLQAGKSGVAVSDLSRQYDVGQSTYYKWKAKYGDMSVSELKRLRQLERDNLRLKQMYASLSMDHDLLKEVLEKKFGVDLAEEL